MTVLSTLSVGCNNFIANNELSLESTNPLDPPPVDPPVDSVVPPLPLSVQAFSTTLQPTLTTSCSGCHGIFQNPKFAVPDSQLGHDTLLSNNLINPSIPQNSRIVQKIISGHSGYSIPKADEILLKIQAWIAEAGTLPDLGQTDPPPPPDPVDPFVATSILSAASKVKYLVHGGALTNSELSQLLSATSASQAKSLLSSFTDGWIETEEYKKKISKFLSITLQQDGANLSYKIPDYYPILGNIQDGYPSSCGDLGNNLREMFVKTAEKIVSEGRPFNEVVTTRKWMVTTASLVMLAWMDNTRLLKPNGGFLVQNDSKKFVDNICTPLLLTSADHNDWREVEFRTLTENTSPRPYTDVTGWRSVTENSVVSFGVPRIGFFTTPMFLRKWITNDDNQFRVTTNQALIGSLNQTFSLTDTTEPLRDLSTVDAIHALPGTACLKCHSSMDPMRDLWKSILNARDYRFHPKAPPGTPVFAFRGVRTSIPTVETFAQVLATHPDFASGWTQKVCQYLNSQTCDDEDPEFKRVVQVFKDSNLNFKTMFKTMLLSPIVTGLENTQNNLTKNFYVSIARRSHLCHAINVRVRAMQAAYGAPLSALDNGKEICSSTKFDFVSGTVNAPIAASITDDTLARGSTSLSQSLSSSPFYSQATLKLCDYSTYYFAQKSTFLPSTMTTGTQASARTDIGNYLTHFVGVPESHPRRALILKSMNDIYDFAYARSTATNDRDKRVASLRPALSFGCFLPEILAVGL